MGIVAETGVSSILDVSPGSPPSRVRIGFETARLRLAEIKSEGQDARLAAYRVACEQSARTLSVERVSIWMLTPERDAIECTLQYTQSTHAFDSGARIEKSEAPAYFDAVVAKRVVVVNEALSDPITTELTDYLISGDVGALLDAPIYRDGEVVGVVCHEHVGSRREWTEKEAGFASAVADMLTILIDQAERAELRAAIDAQRQLEAQNQKMQALVKLARVVTHDLSNLLTIALLRVESLPVESDLDNATQEMSHVLAYGTQLLRHLKDFCEERAPVGTVEVRETMEELAPVIQALVGNEIGVSVVAPKDAVQLAFSRLEFEQVIVNLVGNARDAIESHGEIEVRFSLEGAILHLEVIDSGRGIPASAQARLFEPFFTTKNGHSGIGLAAVYGIVQRANGQIDITSKLGEGTTFHLKFPVKQVQSPPSTTFPWEVGGG